MQLICFCSVVGFYGGGGERTLALECVAFLEEGKLEYPTKALRYINYENLTHMKRGGHPTFANLVSESLFGKFNETYNRIDMVVGRSKSPWRSSPPPKKKNSLAPLNTTYTYQQHQ